MVADNDVAIGMIVDALSHSPFWKSTAVMITQDDTQLAADHVSSLRDYLQVISPWAKPGANHQWGSMGSLLRTIETIFNVDPLSLNDKVALPQHGAFLTQAQRQAEPGALHPGAARSCPSRSTNPACPAKPCRWPWISRRSTASTRARST